jgi:outer membrane protein
MKKLLVAAIAGFSISAVQAASYGVVDIEKVVQSSAYLKQQQTSLQQAIKPQTTQIENLQKDLAGLQQKSQAPKLSDAEKQKIATDFEAKATQLNSLQQQVQSKVQTTMQATNNTFETRVKSAAEQLRKENKMDAVFNKVSVIAYEPSADLTDKLIQKVNAIK